MRNDVFVKERVQGAEIKRRSTFYAIFDSSGNIVARGAAIHSAWANAALEVANKIMQQAYPNIALNRLTLERNVRGYTFVYVDADSGEIVGKINNKSETVAAMNAACQVEFEAIVKAEIPNAKLARTHLKTAPYFLLGANEGLAFQHPYDAWAHAVTMLKDKG